MVKRALMNSIMSQSKAETGALSLPRGGHWRLKSRSQTEVASKSLPRGGHWRLKSRSQTEVASKSLPRGGRVLPPELAHWVADLFLSSYSKVVGIKQPPQWRSVRWKNLYFPNPLAPAGGVDKSAKQIKAWWAFGAGFIEVGTVTPLPQKKNPGRVLDRDWKAKALWNHLGFPGDGAEAVRKRLKHLRQQHPLPTPVFVNIGKNRNTKNEEAEKDYLHCISSLYPYVDAFVINVSSPNTKGLKDLAQPHRLKNLLQAVREGLQNIEKSAKKPKPFLVKWSPDMEEGEFLRALDIALECGAEGHIISNARYARYAGGMATWPLSPIETSASNARYAGGMAERRFPNYGGVSGAPLADMAKKRLKLVRAHLGANNKDQLLISVGGVLSFQDVLERLNMGADLVQVYSALVFNGPSFLRPPRGGDFDAASASDRDFSF